MFRKNKYKSRIGGPSLKKKYIQFRSSIYSRVVLVIGILSIFLLVSNSIIFRSVNEGYINTVIHQNGSHTDIGTMFPRKEKSYRIINSHSECLMSQTDKNSRHLLIRSPILNEPSCYNTTAYHAHNLSEEVLGSLFIKMPLTDVDAAVQRSSREFLA